MPPTGVPLQTWGCLQPGRKAATYLQEPPSSAILGMVMTPLQLPLLNQIWDFLLVMKDTAMSSPPRDARNVTGPHLVGWHRYTRLTSRLAPC